jgi:hypothetical protein
MHACRRALPAVFALMAPPCCLSVPAFSAPPVGNDADGMPPPLLAATATLFGQGLADPRGGAYQAITVETGSVWPGENGKVTATHGWVFPADADGMRFAACWNGLLYPVVAVTGRANLRADVQALVQEQTVRQKRAGSDYGFDLHAGDAVAESKILSPSYPTLLKAIYLLRLGENDLARTVFALWDTGTRPNVNGNNEIRRDPYLYLASQWAWSAYDRAVCAHMRGADRLAAADATLIIRAQPLIEAEASKRGYRQYPDGSLHEGNAPYLLFLHELPTLQRDSLRRAAEPSRPPLDISALRSLPQTFCIAVLIHRLDEIGVRQTGQPGGLALDTDPIAAALIAEGDAAVGPLRDAMEQDGRLTRAVSFGRDFFRERSLFTVRSAAFACLAHITGVAAVSTAQAYHDP